MDKYVSNKIDNVLFSKFVEIIKKDFNGELIEKLDDGFDTKYYDFKIKNCLITLHQIPMNGITIFFTDSTNPNNDTSLINEISNVLKKQNEQI